MASLRKRKLSSGYVWYVDYHDNDGKRHWFNTHTASRKIADQMRSKIEVDLAMETLELPRKKKQVTLSKLRDAYLRNSAAEHDKNTYELNERFLRFFIDFMGDVKLDSITRKDAEEYKLHRLESVGKTSVNMEIRHLKAVFSYSVDIAGYLKENPFKNVKQFKIEGNNLPVFLSIDNIETLLEVIDNRDFKDLVLFYLNTGCRRNEALNLEWENIDFERKMVKITKAKSGSDRSVPLNDGILEILERRRQKQKPFSFKEDFVTHKFPKYLKKTGLNGKFTIHSLRHTFASHLVMNGVDLYSVQKLLGHSSSKVTEMYAHLAPDYLALGVAKLPSAFKEGRKVDNGVL